VKYLCLIYADESLWPRMTAAETEQMIQQYVGFSDSIRASGQFVGGNRLHPASSATTVRVRGGRVSTTDGPFAETKEQLGGYYLIEAADLNDAIQVASRIPGARVGSVEVRPVMEGTRARLSDTSPGA